MSLQCRASASPPRATSNDVAAGLLSPLPAVLNWEQSLDAKHNDTQPGAGQTVHATWLCGGGTRADGKACSGGYYCTCKKTEPKASGPKIETLVNHQNFQPFPESWATADPVVECVDLGDGAYVKILRNYGELTWGGGAGDGEFSAATAFPL